MHHHPYNQERALNLSILHMSGMIFQALLKAQMGYAVHTFLNLQIA